VLEVRESRISLTLVQALRGKAPDRFEVKRAPGRPPPLRAGDQAILLLRGDRAPYILVGPPKRVLHTRDPDEAAALAKAVRAVDAARGDPDRLADRYLQWIDGPLEALRTRAAQSLPALLRDAPQREHRVALDRAGAATDRSRSREARLISSRLAGREPEGARNLVATLAARGALDEPEVVGVALQRGAFFGVDGLRDLWLAALASPAAPMRRVALRMAPLLHAALEPSDRLRIERAAQQDPDPGTRAIGKRALRALRPPGISARKPARGARLQR